MAKAMLGEIEITTVYDERPTETMDISDHPIETGESITDHVREEPFSIVITGMINGQGAADKLDKLQYYKRHGILLTYIYRHYLTNMIIQRFEHVHDKTVNGGFTFTLTLRNVLIAKSPDVKGLKLPASVHVNPVKSKGKQQPKQKTTKKNTGSAAAASGLKAKIDAQYQLTKSS